MTLTPVTAKHQSAIEETRSTAPSETTVRGAGATDVMETRSRVANRAGSTPQTPQLQPPTTPARAERPESRSALSIRADGDERALREAAAGNRVDDLVHSWMAEAGGVERTAAAWMRAIHAHGDAWGRALSVPVLSALGGGDEARGAQRVSEALAEGRGLRELSFSTGTRSYAWRGEGPRLEVPQFVSGRDLLQRAAPQHARAFASAAERNLAASAPIGAGRLAVLTRLGQIDTAPTTDGDYFRCQSASLVAGLVNAGPSEVATTATQLRRVFDRAAQLASAGPRNESYQAMQERVATQLFSPGALAQVRALGAQHGITSVAELTRRLVENGVLTQSARPIGERVDMTAALILLDGRVGLRELAARSASLNGIANRASGDRLTEGDLAALADALHEVLANGDLLIGDNSARASTQSDLGDGTGTVIGSKLTQAILQGLTTVSFAMTEGEPPRVALDDAASVDALLRSRGGDDRRTVLVAGFNARLRGHAMALAVVDNDVVFYDPAEADRHALVLYSRHSDGSLVPGRDHAAALARARDYRATESSTRATELNILGWMNAP